MEEILQQVGNMGFPIIVAMYVLMRFGGEDGRVDLEYPEVGGYV